MKTKIITLFLLFLITFSYSQETYKIEYNYQKDSIKYLELINGKYVVIKKNKFKRNEPYKIEVTYNPLAVDLEVVKEDTEFHFQDKSIGNIVDLINKGQSLSNSNVINEFSLNKIISKSGDSISESNNIIKNINNLKYSLIDIVSDTKKDKSEIIVDIAKYISINKMSLDLNNTSTNSENWIQVIHHLKSNVEELENKFKKTTLNNEIEKKIISQTFENSNLDLKTIEKILLSVKNMNENTTRSFKVEKDETDIKLKFNKIDYYDMLEKSTNDEPDKEANFTIKAKGGFKINTSVAFTLNNFKKSSNEYFVDSQTDIIGADKNDYFVPNLATIINFYPYLNKNINLGGLIGVSFPISQTNSSLNFLFGGTLIVGNQNRIALNGGISYGQVQKLKNGLNIGDTFIGDSNDLIKNVYDTGFFIGFSYNLLDVKE